MYLGCAVTAVLLITPERVEIRRARRLSMVYGMSRVGSIAVGCGGKSRPGVSMRFRRGNIGLSRAISVTSAIFPTKDEGRCRRRERAVVSPLGSLQW